MLKAYACRFRSRIGQSPLARYQRSMYGFLRSPTLEARLNAEVGVATDVQIMEEHMGNDVVTPGGEVVEGVPESLAIVGENNEDAQLEDGSDAEEDSAYESVSMEGDGESSTDEDETKQESSDAWKVKDMRLVYARDTEIKMKKAVVEECKSMCPRSLPGFSCDVIARQLRESIQLFGEQVYSNHTVSSVMEQKFAEGYPIVPVVHKNSGEREYSEVEFTP